MYFLSRPLQPLSFRKALLGALFTGSFVWLFLMVFTLFDRPQSQHRFCRLAADSPQAAGAAVEHRLG